MVCYYNYIIIIFGKYNKYKGSHSIKGERPHDIRETERAMFIKRFYMIAFVVGVLPLDNANGEIILLLSFELIMFILYSNISQVTSW